MNEQHEPIQDELLAAIDRVGAVPIDPAKFPHDPPLEFREAAVELLNQIARLRFKADGGDLTELDEIGVEDTSFAIDLEDLREFVAGFHADGDHPRYAACAAVFDWAVAAGSRPPDAQDPELDEPD
ncbi:MAG: hypothetical protein M3540_06560 [Actinomycetota bacterium]|nr:hypothetical protein [Actinomycetota bacterium]